MTGHYNVKDRGAGEGRGVMGGAEIFFLIEGIDTRIQKESVRAAGTSTVRDGGGLNGWNRGGRRRRGMVPGDVGDVGNESISGAEEVSESA